MNTACTDYAMLREVDLNIHRPTRLAIMTMLHDGGATEYRELTKRLALSMRNLSNHVRGLENARLVNVRKRFEERKPVSTASLTSEGVAAWSV